MLSAKTMRIICIIAFMLCLTMFWQTRPSSAADKENPGIFLIVQSMADKGATQLVEAFSTLPLKLETWDISVQGPADGQKIFDHLGGAVVRYAGNAGDQFKWDEDELYLYSEFMGSRGNFMLVGRNFPTDFYQSELFVDNLFSNFKAQVPMAALVAPVSKVLDAQLALQAPQSQGLICDTYQNVDPGEVLVTIGQDGPVVGVFGET